MGGIYVIPNRENGVDGRIGDRCKPFAGSRATKLPKPNPRNRGHSRTGQAHLGKCPGPFAPAIKAEKAERDGLNRAAPFLSVNLV